MAKEKATRFFAGVSLDEGHEGLVVNVVLPSGPAEKAGLKGDDLLVSAGKQPLQSLSDFMAALKATTTLTFVRRSRTHKTTLRPANLLRGIKAIEDIISGGAKANRICDKNCDCSIRAPNSICETYYVIKGDGPRGGLLLEKNCTFSSLPPGGPPQGGSSNCGTREYF